MNIEDVIVERGKITSNPIRLLSSEYNEVFKVVNNQIELKDSSFYNDNSIQISINKMMAVCFQMKNILYKYKSDIARVHVINPGFMYCEIDKYEKFEYLTVENPFDVLQHSPFNKDTVNIVNILRNVTNSICSYDLERNKNIELSENDILVKIDEDMLESILHYIDLCMYDIRMMMRHLKYIMRLHDM